MKIVLRAMGRSTIRIVRFLDRPIARSQLSRNVLECEASGARASFTTSGYSDPGETSSWGHQKFAPPPDDPGPRIRELSAATGAASPSRVCRDPVLLSALFADH